MLVVVAGEGEARVLGDDGVVDGEDGLRLHGDPRNLLLEIETIYFIS